MHSILVVVVYRYSSTGNDLDLPWPNLRLASVLYTPTPPAAKIIAETRFQIIIYIKVFEKLTSKCVNVNEKSLNGSLLRSKINEQYINTCLSAQYRGPLLWIFSFVLRKDYIGLY